MIAITAEAMIKGALRLIFDESHTVSQIEIAAIALGGTVILEDRQSVGD
jgi:hypothetical protein